MRKPRCPERSVLSQFVSKSLGVSTATLYSMFRFPDSNTVRLLLDLVTLTVVPQVHLQCDILVCAVADCAESLCVTDPDSETRCHHPTGLPQLLPRSVASSGSGGREEDEHRMMASTTVFVLEPGVTSLGEEQGQPADKSLIVGDSLGPW
jgi:hypothetical protein